MKKGDIIEGVVERVDFPDKGIMWAGEERLEVKNAVPGQRVRAVVTRRRKEKSEGRILEVLAKAPEELTEGICPHFTLCGGCIYQSLPYEEQLKLKERQIRSLLALECPEGSFEWQGLKPSPAFLRYRNKMEFSFGDSYKGGPLALGMHKRNSFYDIVTTENCQIVHPDFCRILAATREYFASIGAPFYQKLRHTGYLRHLLVRRAAKTGEILVDLVTTSQLGWILVPEGWKGNGEEKEGREKESRGQESREESRGRERREKASREEEYRRKKETEILAGWADRICAIPFETAAPGRPNGEVLEGNMPEEASGPKGRLAGVLHTWNDALADVVKNDRTEILFGQDFFFEELLGLRFKITPFSFFQTNSLGAEVLYDTVRSYAGKLENQTVFDLYSGTGTIAQILAPVVGHVTGVEIVQEAVEAARGNGRMNGLNNCCFLAGDVLKAVDELKEQPDLIVLDPPRDGIHPKALPKIIGFGVERIIYVSCKPTSLVRDLAVFKASGYYVEKACAVDMFPGTVGIETVVQLSQRKPDDVIEVDLDLDELDIT